MKETNIYLYGQIGRDGITADSIRKKLATAEDNVIIHINSPGGEVYEGYTIYNLLKNSGKNITVIIEGLCASIATLIACAGDKIIMNPTAEFMIHNPIVGLEGDAETLRKVADQLDNIKKTIIAAYQKKTSKSEEELWAMMDKETFLSAQQAKDIGFVDEVQQSLKMVAYLDISKIKIEKTMDQKILEAIENLGKKITSIVATKPKNVDATLQDGTQIYIETEDPAAIVGKAVYLVDANGNQTKAPDGNMVLADGRTIVVASGVISEVIEPQNNDDVEALKAEIENLKSQLAERDAQIAENNAVIETYKNESETIKAEAETIKAESETIKNNLIEFKKDFEKIRNTVIGSDRAPVKPPVKQEPAKASGYFETIVKNIKQNRK